MKRSMFLIVLIMLAISPGIMQAQDLPDTVLPWGVYVASGIPDSLKDSMGTELGLNVINLAWNRTNSSVISYMDRGMAVYPNLGPVIDNDSVNYFMYARAFYMLIEAEDEDLHTRFKYHNPAGSTVTEFWVYEDTIADTILDSLDWYHRKLNETFDTINATYYYRSIRMKIGQFENDSLETTDTLAILYRDMGNYGIDTTYIEASAFYDSIGGAFVDTVVMLNFEVFTLDQDRTVYYTLYSTGEAKLYIDYFKVPDKYGIDLIDLGFYDAKLDSSAYYTFGTKRVAGWYMCDEPAPEQYRAYLYVDSLLQVVVRNIMVNVISSYKEEGN